MPPPPSPPPLAPSTMEQASNEPIVHPSLGKLCVGIKLLHDEFGVLTLSGIAPPSGTDQRVFCSRFNRNGKQVTVSVAILQPIPKPCGAVWRFSDIGPEDGFATQIQTTRRFPPIIEADLEQLWQTGPNKDTGKWEMQFRLAADAFQSGCGSGTHTADLHSMMVITNSGHKRMILRNVQGHGALPLSIVEIEEATAQKKLVQVRGKGLGHILFVNDENAKIALKSGSKTFSPLVDIYDAAIDLKAEEERRSRRIDFTLMKSCNLSSEVLKASQRNLQPLTSENCNDYLATEVFTQWQFRPGTSWVVFPADHAAQLHESFDEGVDLGSLENSAFMTLSSYRASFIPQKSEDWGVQLQCNTIHPSAISSDAHGSDPAFIVSLEEILTPSESGRLQARPFFIEECNFVECTTETAPMAVQAQRMLDSFKATTAPEANPRLGRATDVKFEINDSILELIDVNIDEVRSSFNDRVAFLIEISSDHKEPIIISSPTVDGLVAGWSTILRSCGKINTEHEGTPAASEWLPVCFCGVVQLEELSRFRVSAANTPGFQKPQQFIRFASTARSYQPSHSRLVRRAVRYIQPRGRKITTRKFGPATLVQFKANTSEVVVQLSTENTGHNHIHNPELLRIPASSVYVPPYVPLTGLDWSSAIFCECAATGKGQVIFLEFPGDRLVVIKRTDEPVGELGGYRIGQYLGVKMPHLTVLRRDYGEGKIVEKTLQQLSADGMVRAVSKGSGSANHRNSHFFVVQEFQPGCTLRDLCHRDQDGHWAERAFGESTESAGQRRLNGIGKMIAFDILVHNNDRWNLPGIFESLSGCGNTANIIVSSDGDFVAIDNVCNAFEMTDAKSQSHFDRFIAGVKELNARTRKRHELNESVPAHPALETVRRLVKEGQGTTSHAAYIPPPGYDIGDKGTRAVEAGFCEVLDAIDKSSFEQNLRDIETSVVSSISWLCGENGADFYRVRTSFFMEIAAAMRKQQLE